MTRRKSAWDPGATFDRNDKNQDFIVYPQGHCDGGVCGRVGPPCRGCARSHPP